MMEIPKLNIIIENIDLPNTITFDKMIEERKVLKPQIKLMHILSFDKELQLLHQNGFDLESMNLNDFHLTEKYLLIVPLAERIIPLKENSKTKLKSYLIYLSYLYNTNFLEIYYKNPNYLYNLLFGLNLNEEIKQNLFHLLNYKDAPFFSETMEVLNNASYREELHQDTIELSRKLAKV